MKKFKIIFATVMLGIATIGGFQAYEYANMTGAETIMLENVEALAAIEGSITIICCFDMIGPCPSSATSKGPEISCTIHF